MLIHDLLDLGFRRGGDEARTLIVIAASTGGVEAISAVLSTLPPGLPAAVVAALHRSLVRPDRLAPALRRRSALPVREVSMMGVWLRAGTAYLAPPDRHLVVTRERRLELARLRRIRHQASPANPLLETAAAAYGDRTIAVVLSGSGADAADGVRAVAAAGGAVIVQDPATAVVPGLPAAVIALRVVCEILPLDAIGPRLGELVRAVPRLAALPLAAAPAVPAQGEARAPQSGAVTGGVFTGGAVTGSPSGTLGVPG